MDTGTITRDVLVGIMALLIGIGVLVVCLRIGDILKRLLKTLDVVESEVTQLSAPVTTTLAHVGGIAGTADTTIARLGLVVGRLEDVAASATATANLIGTTVAGVVTGLRKPKPETPAAASGHPNDLA